MFIYFFCTFDEALLLLSKPKEKKILCLVTKQFFMMFGRQAFPVWTGLFKELKQTTMTMTTPGKQNVAEYSCFEKGCPSKAYATMPKGIPGNGVLSP